MRFLPRWPVLLASALVSSCSVEGSASPHGSMSASGGGADTSIANNGSGGSATTGGTDMAVSTGGAGGVVNMTPTGGIAGSDNSGGSDAAISAPSATALADLGNYLALPRAQRPALDTQPFATVPLSRLDAESAASLLWDDFATNVRDSRVSEVGATETQAASMQLDGSTLRYYQAVRGAKPPTGRSLFISMHGGGNTTAATNDSQWDNQLTLVDGYNPQDAIWIAPRAPIDDWNMWFTPDIDALFQRLITNMIVFEGIDPNKVYLTGYSAGGDGVYQLGPRMADCWAGAGMSAGHPNDATPDNLRNVAFAIHVGGDDTAYDRNLKAAEWGGLLEGLAAADGEGGYPNQWQVHAGLPHWMNLEDAVSIPFLQQYTRNPVPTKVVWHQVNVTHSRSYWLAVDEANELPDAQVTATYAENAVTLSDVQQLQRLTIRLSDAMLDMDQPVVVELSGQQLFFAQVARTMTVIDKTLNERGDPTMIFFGEVAVDLQ